MRDEAKELQNIVIKNKFRNTKCRCHKKLIHETIKQHKYLYMRFSAECKYDLAFKDNRDRVETNTTRYYLLVIKNHDKIKEIENMV